MTLPSPIVTTPLDYLDGGDRLSGVLARPAGAITPRPGVLVFHEAWGVNDYAIHRAQKLAELGYVALSADLFGERFDPQRREQAMARTRHYREHPGLLRARTEAARRALAAQPGVDNTRLAAIGYCFGGTAALELARSGAAVRAVVSFHGTLSSAAPVTQAGQIRSAILVCTGADDPVIPPAQVGAFQQEMSDAQADYQILVLGGAGHGFTNPDADALGMPGVAYHAAADRRSWQAMRELLREALA